MRIYAAPTDLPEQFRSDPNAETLILMASNLVTGLIRNAWFKTDDAGMPVGSTLEAAKAAVVMQVSTWLSTGVNPVVGHVGKPKVATSKSTNGSSVSYAADSARDAWFNLLAEGKHLVGSALDVLDAEGLLEPRLAPHGFRRLYMPVPALDHDH